MVSPFDEWRSIIEETTDQFCKVFSEDRDFEGSFATAVGHGALPHGVDPHDPRVTEIRRKCRARAAMWSEQAFTD